MYSVASLIIASTLFKHFHVRRIFLIHLHHSHNAFLVLLVVFAGVFLHVGLSPVSGKKPLKEFGKHAQDARMNSKVNIVDADYYISIKCLPFFCGLEGVDARVSDNSAIAVHLQFDVKRTNSTL
ncbi:LOW QUALITY PROTEIN: hypothetical protein BC937DRAFT_92247 [Endogone sp. FLAS-F59071]|nr:LOW QUALITY PROTEIN: hypothetical protein BC937DRAFT_92247 [Endogone sp. FLAS-F59071]|eukprot:RUS21568.1 LOW QUALITY PROTEIN: hypothetical protein BC937DRAFT_92247 [Endogone sp. FLAS-F59071]